MHFGVSSTAVTPSQDLQGDGSRGDFIDMDSGNFECTIVAKLSSHTNSTQCPWKYISLCMKPDRQAEDVLWFHESLFTELHYKLLIDSDDYSNHGLRAPSRAPVACLNEWNVTRKLGEAPGESHLHDFSL